MTISAHNSGPDLRCPGDRPTWLGVDRVRLNAEFA
jgi:hypothetical protein